MHSYRTDSGGGSGEIVAWRQAAAPFVPATAKPRRQYALRVDAASVSLIGANVGGSTLSAGTLTPAAGNSVVSFTGTTGTGGTITPAAGASIVSATGSLTIAGSMAPAAGLSTVSATGSVIVAGTMAVSAGSSTVAFDGGLADGSGTIVPAVTASVISFTGLVMAEATMTPAAGVSVVSFKGKNSSTDPGLWTLYASEDDMVARFGADEMSNLAEGSDVIQALRDATEEAQSYVSVRYAPPLPNIPAPLVFATCDIARFRLYKDRATEEVKYRYERTIKWLERMADGKAVLTFNPALTPEEVEVVEKPVTPVGAAATQGVFGDDALSLMPDIRRASYW